MSEEKRPEELGGEPEETPDTDSGDEIEGLDPTVAPAIPVAPPLEAEVKPAAPPPPAGPRIFPQQYTMLFANTFVLIGCLTVWERAHITGRDLYGFQSIGGSIVLAFAAYSVLAGVVGLVRGGVNFFSTLGTGFFGLYFGIKVLLRTIDHANFLPLGNLREKMGLQAAVNTLLSQFGPGLFLTLFGGAIIVLLFFKAMFGGKKNEPAPPPARRRSRR
ncbi:MAG: hypothetical protein ACYTEZ_15980 [Planctomycetota bacterium]|jgi:hypothetical protein